MSIRDDLKAYLDGELPQPRMEEIRQALERDPELQREAEFLTHLSSEIQAVCHEPQVEGYERALEAVRRRPVTLFGLRPLQLAGVFGLLMLVSVVTFPLFAQPKMASKRASEMAATAAAPADAAVGGGPAEQRMYERSGSAAALEAKSQAPGGAGAEMQDATALALPRTEVLARSRQRMVIRNGQISLKVDDVQQAAAEAASLATSLGGLIESSNTYRSQSPGARPSATIVLRVPSEHFDAAMRRLRDLGVVLNESMSGEDVTAQHADIAARLKVMRSEEQQYLEILGRTTKIGEVLQVKERLSRVRQEIESLDAQQKALADLSSLSTITASFEQRERVGEPEPPSNWLEEAWASAVNGLLMVGRFLGRALITLFVFSPIWLPVLLLLWWLSRRGRR